MSSSDFVSCFVTYDGHSALSTASLVLWTTLRLFLSHPPPVSVSKMAIVRLKKGSKRFEVSPRSPRLLPSLLWLTQFFSSLQIVCYDNKIKDWRSGVEKDLGSVVGLFVVYTNSSKALVASASELKSAFGTTAHEWIVKEVSFESSLAVFGLKKSRARRKRERRASGGRQSAAHSLVFPSSLTPVRTPSVY